MLPPQWCLTTNSESRPVVLVVVRPRHKQPRTLSIAFRHLPASSARIGYATEGAFFISAQLSTDAVGVLRNVWVLLKSNAKDWPAGAGIAQWLERRTRDWKVAGSNPCWNGGRIFFSRVDFLCWLLFRYPFHPRVTAVARKKSRSFCQKCRWQVTAKHAYTLRMWLLLNRASALVTTCP